MTYREVPTHVQNFLFDEFAISYWLFFKLSKIIRFVLYTYVLNHLLHTNNVEYILIFCRSYFTWTDAYSTQIRSNWEHKCRTRLSDTLSNVWKMTLEGLSPSWIDSRHWEVMWQHWSREEFQRIFSTAMRNKRHATSTNTRGSVSFTVYQEHVVIFFQLLLHFMLL
jgi:hypothetical protein